MLNCQEALRYKSNRPYERDRVMADDMAIAVRLLRQERVWQCVASHLRQERRLEELHDSNDDRTVLTCLIGRLSNDLPAGATYSCTIANGIQHAL